MKKLSLLLFLCCLLSSAFAQEAHRWQVKAGLHYASMIYDHLPFPNSGILYDSGGQFVGFLSGYGDGQFQYRLTPSVMVYKEK